MALAVGALLNEQAGRELGIGKMIQKKKAALSESFGGRPLFEIEGGP
jgi:hypothetical protein